MAGIRRKDMAAIGKKIKKYGDKGELHVLAKELDLSESFLRGVYAKNFGEKKN